MLQRHLRPRRMSVALLAGACVAILLTACGGDRGDEAGSDRALPEAPRADTIGGGQLIYFEAGC